MSIIYFFEMAGIAKDSLEMGDFSWRTWCCESRSCSCRPWRRLQVCSFGRSRNPRTPHPAADRCRPQGHQSHPDRTRREDGTLAEVFEVYCDHLRKRGQWLKRVPGRSPCLPRGIQHRTCWRWSVQGRRSCSCCRSGLGHPGTSGDRGSSLEKKRAKSVNNFTPL